MADCVLAGVSLCYYTVVCGRFVEYGLVRLGGAMERNHPDVLRCSVLISSKH